ncbi:hypothetical protein, conserved [Trypanosoma brucei gambiense DAL972]|uniref:Uncharacterized protein n=1 Tax=Trypanosoma brucei gambiense (strain MHOM/CI/86/DAL972) TaxID=679716 RepID=D0AA52_TRYB9|nr:hypothetical protein, conserved [Trypanosoma brucei gambiense DAL972]CBH18553.1 hypothetical protein, conserved [Trypanosoma brucei gambiense DAL972]|eukprot:XP_011780817.1 hypothetical protein, conserved [Trypanosoma brucei gambiense DAL972]
MSHPEHFGISYANIVYAFLVRVDGLHINDSINQMFRSNSREKKTLIEFLLKKRGNHNNAVLLDKDSDDTESRLPLRGTAMAELTRLAGEDLAQWTHIVKGRYCAPSLEETKSADSTHMRWRLTTSDVVAQLTMVRNTFMANILDFKRMSGTTGPSSSVPNNEALGTLGNIPVSLLDVLHENVVAAIKDSISKLCTRLRKTCPPGSLTRSMVAVDSHVTSGASAQWDWSEAHLLASVVELVWALSVSVVLDAHNASAVCAGGLLYSCRLLCSDADASGANENDYGSQLSLLPPVFFLTHDLAVKLEAHYHAVLQSAGCSIVSPSRVYYSLLSSSCYDLLSQIDEQAVRGHCMSSVRLCVSLLKEARLSCETWESVRWDDIVSRVRSGIPQANRQVLVQDLECLWHFHRNWSEKTRGGRTSLTNDAQVGGLPIILSGKLPSFLSTRFQDLATELFSKCSSLKSVEASKGTKAVESMFVTVFFDALYMCHIFHNGPGSVDSLVVLLVLVKKILPHAKKEKRLRGVVTLLLLGCLFPQPVPDNGNTKIHDQLVGSSGQPISEMLLGELDSWRKCKYSMWYAISVAAMLGCVSPASLLKKMPSFLKTLRNLFSSVDNIDRSSILYSTLHVGGLLVDLHLRNATALAEDVKSCTECFLYYTEKMLVKDLHNEKWREGTGAPACIMAASDLLLFCLQQEHFYLKATGWLLRLLDCRNKTRGSVKSVKGPTICYGQLIAMRALSALCELKYFSVDSKMSEQKNGTKNAVLACNLNCGYHNTVDELYDDFTDTKTQIRSKIMGMIFCRGSCYNYVVTTVEGPTALWHEGHLKNLLTFIKFTNNIQTAINDIRKAAFEYLNDAAQESSMNGTSEFKLQLVSVLIVAGFFTPARAMLDRSLTLPKLLVGADSQLKEAVARVVLPLYLKSGNNSNGSSYGRRSLCSCAFAIYRLAESVIDVLVSEDNGRVEELVKYLTSHLLELRDEMEYITLNDMYVRTTHDDVKDSPQLGRRWDFFSAGAEVRAFNCAVGSRRDKWNWLLIPMNRNVDQLEGCFSSPESEGWYVVRALEGTTLMDALEGLAIILLGHTRRTVRQQALLQLDILASLLSLQRVHCGDQLSTNEDAVGRTHNAPGTSAGMRLGAHGHEGAQNQRFTASEVLKEVGESFEDMYLSLEESYIPFPASTSWHPKSERHQKGMGYVGERSFRTHIGVVESSRGTPADVEMHIRVNNSGSPLVSTPLGDRCMMADSEAYLLIFVSALALVLATHCYYPGSALVRVTCALAGEIVQRGLKLHMEGKLPLWRSCYVLRFLILSVDNTKSLPDANRVTAGGERNRPGHRHGGNTTIVGNFDDYKEVTWQIISRYAEYNKLMDDITVPLITYGVSSTTTFSFFDVLQFLHLGPLEYTWTRDTPLVTFPGVMDSNHPLIKSLRDILYKCNCSHSAKDAEHKAWACLSVFLPTLVVVGRRFFVKPPIIPSREQEKLAIQRTQMEKIIVGTIDFLLLGNTRLFEAGENIEEQQELQAETLFQILDEGNGVAARSWLALSRSLPATNNGDELRASFSRNTVGGAMTIIFLRGLFYDLVTLIFSKETKYLETQLKSILLLKVFYSLTHQVQWFLDINPLQVDDNPEAQLHPNVLVAMEKGVLALQTVILSMEQLTGGSPSATVASIANSFSENFLKWLQHALPPNNTNLEGDMPCIFNIAVTLLVADASSWESMRRVLHQEPVDSPVHRSLFSIMVTAFSVLWGRLERTVTSPRVCVKRISYQTRSDASSDARASLLGSGTSCDSVNKMIVTNSSLIFYALMYSYEESSVGPVFDPIVRSKAKALLQLLCGELLINDTSGEDGFARWFYLLLNATRMQRDNVDVSGQLLQNFFTMASSIILSAGATVSSTAPIHPVSVKIALRLLSLFVRQVEATEESLRTMLKVTQACRNSISDNYIAEVWGGWIAYEGAGRDRFIAVLVTSMIDIADKNTIAYYIDRFISSEKLSQGVGEGRVSLDSQIQSTYYNFFLFSIYQMRLLNQRHASSAPSSSTKYDTALNDITSEFSKDDRIAPSYTAMSSVNCINFEMSIGRCPNVNVAGKGKMAWIAEENIWHGLQRLSQEAVRGRAFSTVRRERCSGRTCLSPMPLYPDDVETSLELSFVKPLVSVLFFASWSIERLQEHGQRLWMEIYRDLSALGEFTSVAGSCEVKNERHVVSSSYPSRDVIISLAKRDATNADEGSCVEDEQETGSVVQQSEASSESDDNTLVQNDGSNFSSSESEEAGAFRASDEKSVIDYGSVVEHCSTESNGTVVVHGGTHTTFAAERTITVEKDDKQSEERKRRDRLKRKKDIYRVAHRDYLTLHIHFSCMLLAHLSSGVLHRSDERDEPGSRFYVVDLAFKVLEKLLKGTVTDPTYRAPNSTKYWLELTLTRLRHRDLMMAQKGNEMQQIWECWDTLLLEESLVFGDSKLNENHAHSPSSTVDIVFAELFMGITGHGRNVFGRRFLQRCLHDSSKWLTQGFMMENRAWQRRHQVHSHISLLCMKVIRSISTCLSLSTENLLVGCGSRHLWVEKMSMQLAEANLLRHLLAVLSDRVGANSTVQSGANPQHIVTNKRYVSCIPVITTLACLLRDITIHEILYSSESQKQGMDRTKPEVLAIATPFGSNSSFPSSYLVSCFWAGFALLFASDAWSSVCDLLTVFHRHGCLKFLNVIPKPPPCSSGTFQLTVLPECAAVQLVLLQQGRLTAKQKRDNDELRSTIGRNYKHNTAVVLKYLSEFSQDNSGSAALLAFSELVLLCDWVSLNLAGFSPEVLKTLHVEESKSRENSTTNLVRSNADLGGPPVYSLWDCLGLFGETWKQSLVVFSGGSGSSLKNLSLRMKYVLDELFRVCSEVFNVPSVEMLLSRVDLSKQNGVHPGSPFSGSGLDDIDVCSLHSCADTADDRCCLCEDNVLSFQQYFEILVVLPFMSLFRSHHTPFPMWSKLLSFVSALLWYHERGHTYITDLLLKFLPDLETALDDVIMQNALVDVNEVPLVDRLLVSVIAEEVLAKAECLKACRPAKQKNLVYDSRRHPLPLVSLIDNEQVITDIVKYLVDSFSTSLGSSAVNLHQLSAVSLGSENATACRYHSTSNRTKGTDGEGMVNTDGKSAGEERSYLDCENVDRQEPDEQTEEACPIAGQFSEQSSDCYQESESGLGTRSHRFGAFVYETLPHAVGPSHQLHQLPIENYCCSVGNTSVDPPKADDEGEQADTNNSGQLLVTYGDDTRTQSACDADTISRTSGRYSASSVSVDVDECSG